MSCLWCVELVLCASMVVLCVCVAFDVLVGMRCRWCVELLLCVVLLFYGLRSVAVCWLSMGLGLCLCASFMFLLCVCCFSVGVM